MINRRQFFRGAAGIAVGGVGATVLASNLKPQNKPVPVEILKTTTMYPPPGLGILTFARLQEAYNYCTFGKEAPDLILVTQKNKNLLTDQMGDKFYINNPDGGQIGLLFNDAIITTGRLGDTGLFCVNRHDEFVMLNLDKPYAPYSRRFPVVPVGVQHG